MPNYCSCKLRIGADKETIQFLSDSEFSFEKIRPRPEDVEWYEWNCDFWGTKWERTNYRLLRKGEMGMEISFTTAWNPPFALFEHLVEVHQDVWLKCDWSEEGGFAGVFIVSWESKEKKVKVESLEWQDWCDEEWHHRMRNDESVFYLHRPRSHCKDEEEYNAHESRMAMKFTRGEEKERKAKIRVEFEKNGKEYDENMVQNEMIRQKADELWPEYKK